MDLIINYLVAEFERIFPDQLNYSPLVRNAIITRSTKMRAIMDFYREKRADLSRTMVDLNTCGGHPTDFTALDGMCCRAFRAAIIDEASRNSPQTSFMLRGFITLNRHKISAIVQTVLASDQVASLLLEYPFLNPLVSEVSNQELLSSLLGQ